MTKSEKDSKIAELRDEAQQFQLRYAYLKLQAEAITEELATLKVLMTAGERKYQTLEQTAVDPDATVDAEHD